MNNKKQLVVAILAAGRGTRMKSDLPKVLHEVGGKPMLVHVIDLADRIGADRIISIIGHRRELVQEAIKNTRSEFVIQDPQLGTAHAVDQTRELVESLDGDMLVLSGDVPLLRQDTIESLIKEHYEKNAGATLLTSIFEDATGYGRIIRNSDGTLNRIVEHKDCNEDELKVQEINSGIYIFNINELMRAIKKVDNNNKQGEYYLPDTLPFIQREGFPVALVVSRDQNEIQGVNTVEQLNEINRIFGYTHDQ